MKEYAPYIDLQADLPTILEAYHFLIKKFVLNPRERKRRIGNVQLYFIWWQFCTLDGVANLDQNIFHRKITPVFPFLKELSTSICDKVWHMCDTLCDT